MYALNCRAHASGRGLIPVAPAAGFHDPATAGLDRWTLFIHGFNNSLERAKATWDMTVQQLTASHVDVGTLVLFFWPGDYSRFQVAAALNYPRTVPIAEETAALLVQYLTRTTAQRSVPLRLSFVAHSLGALVVLEAAKQLRTTGVDVVVENVLLTAAAVPEGLCMPGQVYDQPCSRDTKEKVLYSRSDGVLKNFFEIGQEIADHLPAERHQAVGLLGGPGAGDGERWTSSAHMDRFGHSDYWTNRDSIAKFARIVDPHFDERPRTASVRESSVPLYDSLSIGGVPEEEEPVAATINWWRGGRIIF